MPRWNLGGNIRGPQFSGSVSAGAALGIGSQKDLAQVSALALSGVAGTSGEITRSIRFNTQITDVVRVAGTIPTPISISLAFSQAQADADWIARSTATGVIFANRLDNSSQIAGWTVADSTADHVSLDSSTKPHASAGGSLRFDIRNVDTSASGSLSIPLPAAVGLNSVRWYSFRQKSPPQATYQSWPPSSSVAEASKFCILSRDANGSAPTGSNQDNEIVLQSNNNAGMVSGYWQNNNFSALPVEVGFSSAVNGSDLKDQPSIDRGANPLSGTNPDTGSAWSTNEQERARYGDTYGARSSPGTAVWKPGFGDPLSGGFREYPNEWVTITMRVQIGAAWGDGTTGHRWSVWAAREGQAYQLLWDLKDFDPGSGSSPNYNGFNFLPYTTGRSTGGKKVSARSGTFSSWLTIHTVGLTTPVGDGVLSWDGTNQRLTWAGNGQSAGTARGFSSANGKNTINVIATGESYLVVEKTGTPPGSGTTTETITIADGRQDTQRNVCDFITSTLPINAPGGYAPIGVSAMADLAASMSVGTWAELATNGINNAIINSAASSGGVGNSIPFNNTIAWNPVTRQMRLVSATHNATYFPDMVYDEGSNVWSWTDAKATIGSPTHTYCHMTCRPDNGDYYVRRNGPTQVSTEPAYKSSSVGYGNWSSLPTSPTAYIDAAIGCVWWPGSNTGVTTLQGFGVSGCYVCIELTFGEVLVFDPIANAWTKFTFSVSFAGQGDGGDIYHSLAVYSRQFNCIIVGGGNGNRRMFRMNQDRSVTELTVCPIDFGIQKANMQVDPVTGKVLIWGGNNNAREFYELNPSGSGTYTRLTGGSRQPPAAGLHGVSDPDGGSFAQSVVSCCLPQHGVIAYISADDGGYANMFLYKHS